MLDGGGRGRHFVKHHSVCGGGSPTRVRVSRIPGQLRVLEQGMIIGRVSFIPSQI